MICKKEKEQSIKEYVAEVKRNIGDGYLWVGIENFSKQVLLSVPNLFNPHITHNRISTTKW
jgi:hypothetical protein